MSGNARTFDIVVYGATGFVGQLLAEYIVKHADAPRWAIAGRSKERLESMRNSLGLPKDIGILVASNADNASLKQMAAQARCVINLVGPYRKFGAFNVIEACIEQRTHYVDLNAESLYSEEVIQAYHERARQAGVVIGLSSGCDSVPSDLVAYLAVQHAKQRAAKQGVQTNGVREVNSSTNFPGMIQQGPQNSFSTGTLLSFVDMGDEDHTQLELAERPLRLSTPIAQQQYKNKKAQFTFATPTPQFGPRSYGGSWILCPHNVRHVYRSWSLLQEAESKDAYGSDFTYTETMHGGPWLLCVMQSAVMYVFALLLTRSPAFRSLLKRFLPPNWGPSRQAQERMSMESRALATLSPSDRSSTIPLKYAAVCTLIAHGHPGYSITAQLVTECALLLSLDDPAALHALARKGGVLTAATIGAPQLAKRLERHAGFQITCSDFTP